MHTLTGEYDRRDGIVVSIEVAQAAHTLPVGATQAERFRFRALIDTGASHTSISSEVVRDLKHKHAGFVNVTTASEKRIRRPTYLIDLFVQFDTAFITFPTVHAVQIDGLHHDVQLLLGRDFLFYGTLVLTNSSFEFRVTKEMARKLRDRSKRPKS